MFRALRECSCMAVLLVLNLFGMAQQPESASADQIWNQLVAGNHRFATGKSCAARPASSKGITHQDSTSAGCGAKLLRQSCPSGVDL